MGRRRRVVWPPARGAPRPRGGRSPTAPCGSDWRRPWRRGSRARRSWVCAWRGRCPSWTAASSGACSTGSLSRCPSSSAGETLSPTICMQPSHNYAVLYISKDIFYLSLSFFFFEPVAEQGVQLNDGLFLLRRESASLDVRSEIIGPPEPAALAAPLQSCWSETRGTKKTGGESEE